MYMIYKVFPSTRKILLVVKTLVFNADMSEPKYCMSSENR